MAPILFGVEPRDPATVSIAALLMMVVALTAAWRPVRHAATVDPSVVVRAES